MPNKAVLTGTHFMTGDDACAEGGMAAGCTFFAGYPITPATEVAERMAKRLPQVGGVYIQMEDELASMAAIIGASSAGVRAMTATSGPGHDGIIYIHTQDLKLHRINAATGDILRPISLESID